MEITLAYEKLLLEHNIKVDELPKDAQIGVENIQQIIKAINVNEKTGKTIKSGTIDKIKAYDKWVVREILDYIDDKDTNTPAAPHKAAEIIEEIKTAPVEPAAATPAKVEPPAAAAAPAKKEPKAGDDTKAGAIDAEFEALLKAGKTKLTLDELKTGAKTAYDIVFENYEADAENGIETTHYTLVETEKEVFTLTKK